MAIKTHLREDLKQLPLFLLLFGAGSVAMFVPALFAVATDEHAASQAFFYAGLLGAVAFLLIGVAHAGRRRSG